MLPKIYPVTCHTDHVGPESIFVAIKGFKQDGAQYIEKAISLGAKKIVLDINTKIIKQKNIDYIFTHDTRKALAELSAQALNFPTQKLKIIGVTGTKGKTTTTYLIEHILNTAGFKTALLGTIKNKILNEEIESSRTTPESDFLQIFFSECVNKKVDYVVMEVSSHALSLNRVHTINFDIACFTNIGQDHLDFYGNMEEYFKAKLLIQDQTRSNGAIIINIDDDYLSKQIQEIETKSIIKNQIIIKVSNNSLNKKNTDYAFQLLQNNLDGLKFIINQQNLSTNNEKYNYEIYTPNLFGEFNAYNISMAFAVCKQLAINPFSIKMALRTFLAVPGRLQIHKLKNGSKAFVDYAHNPSSMISVLKTLRPLNKKLIVVFGCGGDKDTIKRPIMGQISTEYADIVIITNDNPRTEDASKIINNILTGISIDKKNKVLCIPNRAEAISKAVELSDKNSIIAILGKGHENYYIEKDQRSHFDDFEEISRF